MRAKTLFSIFPEKKDENLTEKLKIQNPKLWKRLKKKFDIGRQIVTLQTYNGLDTVNENTIRYYLKEYAGRFLNLGPHSFPTSFNVLEPFFIFNAENSILQLIEEEEAYSISLLDFLNFVTSNDFNLDNIDYFENIPENIIYHFQFSSDGEEYNFSSTNDVSFFIGNTSLVRRGNHVSMLLQCGETYDKNEAEEYLKDRTKEALSASMSERKKSLGLTIETDQTHSKVVNFKENNDLWSYNVSLLFDIKHKTIDIRHVARDENLSFRVLTDDFFAIFAGQTQLTKDERKEIFNNQLKELSKYDAVFDFARYCLALPHYVFENEEKLVDVTYETKLSELLVSPLVKRNFHNAPNKYKIYAKPLYYLESDSQAFIKNNELNDNSFQIEKSGFWKRIGIEEAGFDKYGKKVIGKTWVERNDTYYTAPKVVTKIKEVEKFTNESAGYIYIMRQPAHEENIFKIGLTKRDVKIRSKELSNTSTIDNFFVIHKYLTKDCIQAEQIIHEKLNMYRLTTRREFFKCDLEIIMNICSEVITLINQTE
ncbi:hypothetical protein J2786_002371 [Chryseobacterium vietnamense]|uniref:Uncharacterized protein n=1 Tax=Chryseobacterium vietnamense TaxID=866785 RepID=A0ACC6J8K0_9FLAO|nr:GIY-YIG nuclease family protein [Chryseobacterium vietnamense]MDR6459264.1 hypothetical protein [Chryseobacterium vietnamense]